MHLCQWNIYLSMFKHHHQCLYASLLLVRNMHTHPHTVIINAVKLFACSFQMSEFGWETKESLISFLVYIYLRQLFHFKQSLMVVFINSHSELKQTLLTSDMFWTSLIILTCSTSFCSKIQRSWKLGALCQFLMDGKCHYVFFVTPNLSRQSQDLNQQLPVSL